MCQSAGTQTLQCRCGGDIENLRSVQQQFVEGREQVCRLSFRGQGKWCTHLVAVNSCEVARSQDFFRLLRCLLGIAQLNREAESMA